MAERKDRHTTREDEDKLARRKDTEEQDGEAGEEIPTDDPPSDEQKKDFKRAEDIRRQRSDRER